MRKCRDVALKRNRIGGTQSEQLANVLIAPTTSGSTDARRIESHPACVAVITPASEPRGLPASFLPSDAAAGLKRLPRTSGACVASHGAGCPGETLSGTQGRRESALTQRAKLGGDASPDKNRHARRAYRPRRRESQACHGDLRAGRTLSFSDGKAGKSSRSHHGAALSGSGAWCARGTENRLRVDDRRGGRGGFLGTQACSVAPWWKTYARAA